MRSLLKKILALFRTSPRLAAFCGLSVMTFLFGFTLFSFTYLLPGTETAKAENIKNQKSVQDSKHILELHIANNGMTYIQGARVVSISGVTITLAMAWNNVTLEWAVHTDESYAGKRHFGTRFLDHAGKYISISDIHVGDIVTVSGDLDTHVNGLAVKADTVRFSH